MSQQEQTAPDRLLTSGEVAAVFSVDRGTVARWARSGRLHAVRTVGGHRRFRREDVAALCPDAIEGVGN